MAGSRNTIFAAIAVLNVLLFFSFVSVILCTGISSWLEVPEYILQYRPTKKDDDFNGKVKVHLQFTDRLETPLSPSLSVPFIHGSHHSFIEAYSEKKEIFSETGMIQNFSTLPEDERISIVLQALAPLNAKCILKRVDYWTYEYCHCRRIKQFHFDFETMISRIIGRHEIKDTQAARNMVSFIPSEYLSHVQCNTARFSYGRGDICNVNSQPRKVFVDFVCNPGISTSQIQKFSELQTCEYSLVIETPLLCHIDWFRPSGALPLSFSCMLKDSQYLKKSFFFNLLRPGVDSRSLLVKAISDGKSTSPFAPSNGVKPPYAH